MFLVKEHPAFLVKDSLPRTGSFMQTRGINSISRDYHVLRVRRLLPNKVGKGRVLRSGSQKRIPHPFSANRFPRENSQGVHQSIRFDGYFFSSLFLSFSSPFDRGEHRNSDEL